MNNRSITIWKVIKRFPNPINEFDYDVLSGFIRRTISRWLVSGMSDVNIIKKIYIFF